MFKKFFHEHYRFQAPSISSWVVLIKDWTCWPWFEIRPCSNQIKTSLIHLHSQSYHFQVLATLTYKFQSSWFYHILYVNHQLEFHRNHSDQLEHHSLSFYRSCLKQWWLENLTCYKCALGSDWQLLELLSFF